MEPTQPADPHAQLARQLDDLRNEGAWRLDPVRFRYIESLARRLPTQPEAVRRLLQDKLGQAVADYAQRHLQARTHGQRQTEGNLARPVRRLAPGKAGVATPSLSPALAELNAYIRSASQALRGPALPGQTDAPHEPNAQVELASVRRFRQAWSHQRTQDQVTRAVARKPTQAGPLNSHALALQSLALMQALSPDYLRRFMLQVESLQWLDQAARQYPAVQGKGAKAAKPARRGRARK